MVSDNRPEATQCQIKLYLNPWLLSFWIGLSLVFYGLTGYRGWLVLFIGSAGAWFLGLLWVRSLSRNLRIERELHLAWARVGDSVHEQFKLINVGRLPALWVEIADTSSTLATPIRMVSGVESHATRTRHFTHICRRRGLYTLGPTLLRTSDPFSIFTLTIFDQHSDTILVTPPLVPLRQLRITPGGWAGDQQRYRHALERDISDVGVRNYAPGDSLRRIHWRASAHSDALIVRQLEAVSSTDWWIFVDLESVVQAGSGLDSTLELSIVLAASLAMHGIEERRKVGLALVGPKLVWLEPRADLVQRWRILRALSMAEAGDCSLSDLIAVGRLAQTAARVVITPTQDPAWVTAIGRNRGDSHTTTFLIDPTEFNGQVDQSRVSAALAHHRIRYTRISRWLLEEAYPSLKRSGPRHPSQAEGGKRYLKQGGAVWQNMG
jgi:uncharacterized protein (DUF58 family)